MFFLFFYIAGKLMENVQQYSGLGHIITNRLDDTDDIFHCRCNLIGQINSVLCYFRELDSLVKARLMKSYCFSLYGCVLWDFSNGHIDALCTAWWKGLRRFLTYHMSCIHFSCLHSQIPCQHFMRCVNNLLVS